MDSMELVTPVNASVFGFLSLFGYFNVRVLAFVRVFDCSGCSVDFVEKLWENLRKTLWINCGKRFLDLWKKWFYTTRGLVFHELCKIVESFTRDFTHKLFSVGEEFCTFSTGFITTIINIFRKEGK